MHSFNAKSAQRDNQSQTEKRWPITRLSYCSFSLSIDYITDNVGVPVNLLYWLNHNMVASCGCRAKTDWWWTCCCNRGEDHENMIRILYTLITPWITFSIVIFGRSTAYRHIAENFPSIQPVRIWISAIWHQQLNSLVYFNRIMLRYFGIPCIVHIK